MKLCEVVAVAVCAMGCDAIHLHGNASTSAIMLVAGVSSPVEMCLLENAGRIGLEACSAAIAAGDGRELWSLLGGGQLMNLVSKKCASAAARAATLSTSDCESASTWKLLPNGQAQVGEKCLSQAGDGAGTANVAAHAAAAATSSANSISHAAEAAVDLNDATFWASRPGDTGPVALTIDLGEVRNLNLVKISWEFPAQSFAVSASSDGSEWTEVFATSVNVVSESRIPVNLAASKVRVDMNGPPPRRSLSGQPMFGIRSVVVLASRLDVVLDDCATVSQSEDARDKYFPVTVSDFDLAASATFRAALPAVVAAKASLSAALGKIVALPGCADQAAAQVGTSELIATSSKFQSDENVGGLDVADVKLLLATARTMIVSAREALG